MIILIKTIFPLTLIPISDILNAEKIRNINILHVKGVIGRGGWEKIGKGGIGE